MSGFIQSTHGVEAEAVGELEHESGVAGVVNDALAEVLGADLEEGGDGRGGEGLKREAGSVMREG